MTFRRTSLVYLNDIREATDRIAAYTAKGKRHFFGHGMVQDAVIRQLSIIGEAAGKLPRALRASHPEIPWREIIAMRNILIHDYSHTNLDTVWIVVKRDLPVLRRAIEAMLREKAA